MVCQYAYYYWTVQSNLFYLRPTHGKVGNSAHCQALSMRPSYITKNKLSPSIINPRPCAAFYSIQLVVGGSVGPPRCSAPDGPRASRKKRACCPQWEKVDGIQFYCPRSTGDLRSQVKHPNWFTWDGDLADAIKPTKASESLSKWLRTVQITLILT